MKGLWILGGLAATAALLAVMLAGETKADLERLYDAAARERPAIEKELAAAADLVRWFADRRPTEKKKGELEGLRLRFESLEKAALAARDDESRPREERRRTLTRLAEEFWQLRRDAEDLHARLGEMKSFDEKLRPQVVKVADLTRRLAQAQSASTDPEFQQRASELLEEARKFRKMAEEALKTMAASLKDGRALGISALNELGVALQRIEELLDKHPGAPRTGGDGR